MPLSARPAETAAGRPLVWPTAREHKVRRDSATTNGKGARRRVSFFTAALVCFVLLVPFVVADERCPFEFKVEAPTPAPAVSRIQGVTLAIAIVGAGLSFFNAFCLFYLGAHGEPRDACCQNTRSSCSRLK